jgi:hypothetical protein
MTPYSYYEIELHEGYFSDLNKHKHGNNYSPFHLMEAQNKL